MNCSSTSVTILTAEGRSAVAVIAIVGPQAEKVVDQHFQAANGLRLSQQPLGRILYGQWGDKTGEDLVVCRRDMGTVEVHCHGGTASIDKIVEHLTAAGCQQTNWRHCLDNSLASEAHTALAEANTLRTATILLDQYHGALRTEVLAIRESISREEEKLAQEKIRSLLRYADLGRHLTNPWRVVISGLPNVGKSSLINAIVGYQRAIVFDQPGTTRDVVSATTAIEGWPVKFSDTAGLHETADDLENAGIQLVHDQLADVDLVVWVIDAEAIEANTSLDKLVDRQLEAAGVEIHRNSLLVVVNKIDRLSSSVPVDANAIAVSALVGTGLDIFLKMVASSLVPHLPSAGIAIPFSERQVSILGQGLKYCQDGQLALANSVLGELLLGK